MEKTKTTKTSRTKGKATGTEAKIKSAYIDFLLNNGKQPSSIYKFCLNLGLKEEEFYNHFGSFETIEKNIWNQRKRGVCAMRFTLTERILDCTIFCTT